VQSYVRRNNIKNKLLRGMKVRESVLGSLMPAGVSVSQEGGPASGQHFVMKTNELYFYRPTCVCALRMLPLNI
jgi:hypothetical protein